VVRRGIILWLVLLTLVVPFVLADQTQLYSKIFLDPYYRESTTSGVTYNYTLQVNPPDGLTHVYSSTITFQAYLSPSVNFTLRVNNQTCNTPNYYVSTTYATSGQGTASFDCSNIINKSGNYSVQLTLTKNTGAINGWLDLTYTNKPIASMDVFGTEYKAGDDGTIFLLLKDPNGIPITNATCVLDIYLPLSANNTHVEWVNDGLMRYLEEGLYYYDFIAPLYSGVYMVNAKCTYATSDNQYYTLSSNLAPTRNVTTGTYSGDPFVLDDYGEWLYTQCDSGIAGGGGKACDSFYTWNLTAGGLAGNVTQLFVQYLGENNGANLLIMYWWNWSNNSWVQLPNNLTFKATASSGVPIGVDEYLSNSVPLSAISPLNRTRIRILTTSGSTFKQWDNFLVLKAVQYGTTIQDLKGSGEIHVSGSPIGENDYFKIDTCQGYSDGRCGFFTNDDEFDLVEGEIEDYLNISASSTREAQIHYETPFSVDCTAIYWIKEWNGTDWVDFTDFTTYSQPSFQNCIVTLNKNIVTGTDYQFWFKMDNYMRWEVEYTEQITRSITDLIGPLCSGRNFTYETPITETTLISNDTITDFCHRTYDDFYWISSYYNDSQGVDIAGEYASYLQEMRFYRQELFNRYQLLSTAITTQSILTRIDSLGNLTQLNLSQINNQLLNITGELLIHKGMIQQVIDYLTNTIYPYLQQIWGKLLGLETQLNTTINITNQSLGLDTEINSTTHGIGQNLSLLNLSMLDKFTEKDLHIQSAYDNMSSQVTNLSNNVTQKFNQTWEMILALNLSQGQENSVILSYLQNITQAINSTQTQLLSVNQSLTQQIQNTSNNTQTQITNLNISSQARFDQLQSFLENLSIQVSQNHNLTQQNLTDLQSLMLSVNMSLSTDISNLNSTLYSVRGDLLAEINQTYNYLIAMNQSLSSDLLLINQSLSTAIQTFRNEVQDNFTAMFSTLSGISNDLNGTRAELQGGLSNLSQQLIDTNTSIQLQLTALNMSIQSGFQEKDAHIQSAYDNITSQINNLSITWNGNFSQVLDKIDNLSNQVETNHNITQSNLTYINNYLTNLNSSIQQGFLDINTSISNSRQDILDELTALNQSLTQSISEFRVETQANFTTLFQTLTGISGDLNSTKQELQAGITNLSLQLNQTEQNLNSQLLLINSSLSSDLAWLKNDTAYMINYLSDLNISLEGLKVNLTSNEALLLSVYYNLSDQMNQNTTSVLNQIIATNQTLSDQISLVKNDTQAIITQIGELNTTIGDQYDNLTGYITSLQVEVSNNHNITQQNLSVLFGLMSQLNTTCNDNYLDLNQSIGDLKTDVNTFYLDLNSTINSKIDAMNLSLSQAISLFKSETSGNFNQTFLLISALSGDLNSTKAELKSDILNLSLQLNETKASIIQQIGFVNQTIVDGFIEKDAHIQSVYDNLTLQIVGLNSNMTAGFSEVNSQMTNLSILVDTNHNITQTNISELKAMITDLNLTFNSGMSQLNQSINQTGENLVGEINSLKNLLLSINQTLTADIIENRNTLILVNQSLSSQINLFENSTTNNFNTTFSLLNGLEAQNNLTHELLGNLSVQLNQTNWDIQSRLDIMNQSIQDRFDTLDSNVTTIISLLNNLSLESNLSIQGILDLLNNLSVQASQNHNITQQNLSTLFIKCDNLNSTMTTYYLDLRSILEDMNMTLVYVNETNSWILQQLNISSDDLNMVVTAPNKCLVDTNWLVKAQVYDRFGNTLSYLDGVQCNMTTDLWGTANMTYLFVEQKFKYIHPCDMSNTTFNWSVSCGRT